MKNIKRLFLLILIQFIFAIPAFPVSVDGALDQGDARADRRQGIGQGESTVVVAVDPEKARVIHIKNTLEIAKFDVSGALLEEVVVHADKRTLCPTHKQLPARGQFPCFRRGSCGISFAGSGRRK